LETRVGLVSGNSGLMKTVDLSLED